MHTHSWLAIARCWHTKIEHHFSEIVWRSLCQYCYVNVFVIFVTCRPQEELQSAIERC